MSDQARIALLRRALLCSLAANLMLVGSVASVLFRS